MSERKVATDALETLGTILDDNQKRDAIHIAVEPVIAGENFKPGQHITVTDGVAWKADVGKGLGIVDPFLTTGVKTGQKFWFLMYPRMVTSLRHVWAHPAFKDETGTTAATPADKAASETWLRNFCNANDTPGYEMVMELIENETIESSGDDYDTSGRYDRDYLHFNGSDAHASIPPEFWDHVEIVLGRKVPYRPSYFSCSC